MRDVQLLTICRDTRINAMVEIAYGVVSAQNRTTPLTENYNPGLAELPRGIYPGLGLRITAEQFQDILETDS